MLDNGATVNIVKLKALEGSLTIDTSKALKIGGITPESLQTIGTVNLTILKKPYAFHVVNDSFPLSEDGIIGRNLMKAEEAVMSYYLNAIVLAGDVMNPIPFLSHEERAYHLNQRDPLSGQGYPRGSLAPIYSIKSNTGWTSCHGENPCESSHYTGMKREYFDNSVERCEDDFLNMNHQHTNIPIMISDTNHDNRRKFSLIT